MQNHLKWRLDRLAGMLDVFPSLEYVAWQLENKGVIEDDCDGLAYVAARGALQLADSPNDVYIVTLVLDPARMAVASAAHVICVFRKAGKWYVVSNGKMDARQYPSFWGGCDAKQLFPGTGDQVPGGAGRRSGACGAAGALTFFIEAISVYNGGAGSHVVEGDRPHVLRGFWL